MSLPRTVVRSLGRAIEYVRAPAAILCFLAVYRWRSDLAAEIRLLVAWNAYVAIWLAFSWALVLRLSPEETKRWVFDRGSASTIERLWPGRAVGFAFVVLLSLLGLAFAILVFGVRSEPGSPVDVAVLASSALAVVLAWFALHTAFALHYAAAYYRARESGDGGLLFGDEEPSLADFAYFAFTLGTTFAVSDVSVTTRRMRLRVLAHTLLGFAYNTGVLGLVVNAVFAI